MATDTRSEQPLAKWYRDRIGEPLTDDEVVGYWVFALGLVLGVVGIGLLLAADLTGPVPQWPVVVLAVALVLLVAGPIIRLPLRREATWFVYLGVVLSGLAIPWFVSAYPGWRAQATPIIALYSAGIAAMAIAGVAIAVLTPFSEQEARIIGLEIELEELREALGATSTDEDDLAERIRQLRSDLTDAKADEADLAERLRSLEESQAQFELYEDRAGEHRWRLRHRNGNIIADSGEGYTQRHNAQKGMESVRRNALGAAVFLKESEAELPDEDEEFDPVAEIDSRATFEYYEDDAGEYRWRLRHDNGNVIADSGEGYASRPGVQTAIEAVREYAGLADYLRFDPAGFEIYRDRADEWRWRLVHRNGNVIADSGEGYSRRRSARRAVDRIREGLDELEFEIYEDEAGEYRWRLLSGNDLIVADSGEGYATRNGAEEAVERIGSYAPEADVLDFGQAAFEVFEDEAGEYRWRLRHRNGNIIADSGEGYGSRTGAHDGIDSVKRNAPNAAAEETDA